MLKSFNESILKQCNLIAKGKDVRLISYAKNEDKAYITIDGMSIFVIKLTDLIFDLENEKYFSLVKSLNNICKMENDDIMISDTKVEEVSEKLRIRVFEHQDGTKVYINSKLLAYFGNNIKLYKSPDKSLSLIKICSADGELIGIVAPIKRRD